MLNDSTPGRRGPAETPDAFRPAGAAAPRRRPAAPLLLAAALSLLAAAAAGQTGTAPAAPPPAEDDVIKVSAEEVRLNVAAYDTAGRFDPTLSADDLLVREDGQPQRVTGVYRVPAYVLLLADTGGERNPSKTARLTGDVAAAVASALRPEDRVALMQVSGRVELLQGWSADRPGLLRALRTKLLSGKRSALAEGLARAADYALTAPAGNRHVVIISDGLGAAAAAGTGGAADALAAAGVTVHVLSYTSLWRHARRPPATRPRERNSMPEEGVMSIPRTDTDPCDNVPDMRGVMEAKGGGVVDLDRLLRRDGGLKKEMARGEAELGGLAEETGGGLWLPADVGEMLRQAAEVAREVDSRYVVTYRPHRPLAGAEAGGRRRLDVVARRQGLRLRARRGYVAKAP